MVKLTSNRKFDEFFKNRIKIGLGYKDIVQQVIVIPPNADEQLKRIFVLLGSLKCGNSNKNLLAEFTALFDQLYKNNKISKLLYKTLYYKSKYLLDSNMKH